MRFAHVRATISSRGGHGGERQPGEQRREDQQREITSREWITAETGEVAPARTLAAERAIKPRWP